LTSIAGGAFSARCLEADADRDTPQPFPRMSPALAALTISPCPIVGYAVATFMSHTSQRRIY
jgi:hypothetical protein